MSELLDRLDAAINKTAELKRCAQSLTKEPTTGELSIGFLKAMAAAVLFVLIAGTLLYAGWSLSRELLPSAPVVRWRHCLGIVLIVRTLAVSVTGRSVVNIDAK